MPDSRALRLAFRAKTLIAPALIFLLILGVAFILRDISFKLIDDNIEQASRQNCYKVVNLLQANLQERISSLRQFADFMTVSDHVTEGEIRAHARFMLRRSPEIVAVAALDSQRHPLWLESEGDLKAKSLSSIVEDPAMAGAFERAITSQDIAITQSSAIPGKGEQFTVLVPFFKAGQPRGFLAGIFSQAKLLEALLLPELRADFNVTLRQATRKTYDSFLFSASSRPLMEGLTEETVRGVEEFFFIGPQMWEVKVESTGLSRSDPAYLTPKMILALGSVLALLLSLFVYRQEWRAAKFQAEAQAHRQKLASTGLSLAQIQENLDLILNTVDEGIILYDERFTPVQFNAAFKTAFGDAESAVSPDRPAEEHHKALAALFQNQTQYWALLNAIRENPEHPIGDHLECKISDENTRFFQRRATTVCGPDGTRKGYLVIYQDVTPARAVERLKEDFLSSVTHDLRTPLASIKGFAETLLRDGNMDPGTRGEFASIIRTEATRLEEMIEDLLDIRRMEEGRTLLAPASYSLRELVEEVARASRPLLDLHGLKLEIRWEGESNRRRLFGDVAQMGRALRNILGNSIKYAPGNSLISIRGWEGEDRVEMEIADQGSGIPSDDLPHVFEKFYRGAKHVRRTGGTGLGLAIVKHIVESHGGVVSASNVQPHGAAIRMVLPREFGHGVGNLASSIKSFSAGENEEKNIQTAVPSV